MTTTRMKLLRRATGLTVAAALALTAAVTTSPTALADPVSNIDWKPCEDADGDVKCGSIEVPVDYDDPDGEKITIGLAKRDATNPDARVGTLLGTSVNMVTGHPIGSKQLREKFDLIGFDPRGFFTSSNIECDPDDLEKVGKIGVPTDRKSFSKRAKANKKLAKGCRKLTGDLFDHADNLHIVADIESVRQALGEKKLNFYGDSIGSFMGQQYAEKYPKNIRTMVLDGNMDHSLEDAWEYATTETAAVERNFNSFAKWCDKTRKCALYGKGTAKVYGGLREAAKAGKLSNPETGEPIDFYAFAQWTAAVNFPQSWPDLAADLKTLRQGKGALKLKDESPPVPVTYITQMLCPNWDMSVANFGEWKDISTQLAAEHPNTQWSPYVDFLAACIGEPVKTTNPPAPLEIDDAPPLVMIGNLNDFATVYEWSETAAEQSGATLITYEGYGHTIYSQGVACVDEPVEAYFIDGTVPDEGISCESRDKPGGA